VDFDEFLTERAQPHMVDADRYAAAMEDPFDRALSLVDLSRGNRRESDASYTLEDHIASLRRDKTSEEIAALYALWGEGL
jgi:hypothetical protein